MSRDISIAVSAKDNFSQAINTMRNAGIHFNKNLEEMQIQLNGLNRTRATLRLDTKDAQQNLQNIQKEYLAAKKSGEGMISIAWRHRKSREDFYYGCCKESFIRHLG